MGEERVVPKILILPRYVECADGTTHLAVGCVRAYQVFVPYRYYEREVGFLGWNYRWNTIRYFERGYDPWNRRL